jgi:hypothetical protein
MAYIIIIIVFIVFGSGIAVGYFSSRDKRIITARERTEFDQQKRQLQDTQERLMTKENELKSWEYKIKQASHNVITYEELQQENLILKMDLQNIDVECRKLKLDHELQNRRQDELNQKINNLGQRYLKENVKWTASKLSTNNYVNSKTRLLEVISLCRGIGFEIPDDQEQSLIIDLKEEYEKIVRADYERQEQIRIKAQIREEQKIEREIQKEMERLERERAAIQSALEKALKEAEDKHSEEVDILRAKLKEAEEKTERMKSQAQLTKAGHIYVISNIGSFGKEVYKIGMTRRLEPTDRVKELGDASVPFPFDIHMMISCDDAPSLENALHKALHKNRVNKIKPRKEFFRTDINTIKKIVENNYGEVTYIADAEALEYYQSIDASEEDVEFIEEIYSEIEEEHPDLKDE